MGGVAPYLHKSCSRHSELCIVYETREKEKLNRFVLIKVIPIMKSLLP